jgi:hypothetical protein
MPLSPDDLFVGNACQYYVAARFLVHAQRIPVCGNLFHHAVEMLLKGGLAKKRKLSLSALKKMGHKLKVLGREYKLDFPNPALKRHDKTISLLDKFKDIRYPDSILASGMGVVVQWSGPLPSVPVGGPALKTPKQYTIIVSDIDDLVAEVFRTSSWTPGASAFIGTNRFAKQTIRRHNKHARYLTKFP